MDSFPTTVSKVPLGGGASVQLGAGVGQPFGLAMDATHVYWMSSPFGVWTLSRAAKE